MGVDLRTMMGPKLALVWQFCRLVAGAFRTEVSRSPLRTRNDKGVMQVLSRSRFVWPYTARFSITQFAIMRAR